MREAGFAFMRFCFGVFAVFRTMRRRILLGDIFFAIFRLADGTVLVRLLDGRALFFTIVRCTVFRIRFTRRFTRTGRRIFARECFRSRTMCARLRERFAMRYACEGNL